MNASRKSSPGAWPRDRGSSLLAYILPLFLWLPGQALAQATTSAGSNGLRFLAQALEEPPPTPAPTPPPSTIPSTAPPVFTRPEGLGIRPAATFELHPTAGLSEEYSDNFNQSSRNKQENFRTTLSPGLILLINGAFTKGQIGYTLLGTQDSSTEETGLFHSLLGQVSWEATPRLRLTASDVLTRSDEPARADQLGLRRGRRTFTSNGFSLASDYLPANVATQAYYRLGTFFEDHGQDTTTHAFGGSASTAFYQIHTGRVGYEYQTSETSGTTGTS